MDARWLETFQDFGPDAFLSHPTLHPFIGPLQRIDSTSESPEACRQQLKQSVLQRVPKAPGVYGMLDVSGRLIYVGKSKLLRNRLLSYFLPGNQEDKSGRIVEHSRAIVWEPQPNEFAALLREQTLIRRWQPRLNVVGMPNRQQPAYLCLGRGPAQQFYIARQWDPTATCCRGPFLGAGNLFRAVELLNRLFLLRDCSPKTTIHLSDQLTLFPLESRAGCLRAEIGNCLAPCQLNISRRAYEDQEALAIRFLSGEPGDVLSKLELEMQRAAAGCHYERAARLREDLRILRWLIKKLQQHRSASENPPCIYWEASPLYPSARGILYLLRNGGVQTSVACPTDAHHWPTVREAIRLWLTSHERMDARFCRSEDSLGLVTAWFQKHRKLKRNLFPILEPKILDAPWQDWDARWVMTNDANLDDADDAEIEAPNHAARSLNSPKQTPEQPTDPTD